MKYGFQVYGGADCFEADYDRSTTYEGGRQGTDQAIADLQSYIQNNRPPAVQMYLFQYGLAKEVGWHSVVGSSGFLQPEADWFHIHLPNQGQDIYKTVGDMRTDFVSSPATTIAFFTKSSGYRAVSSASWAEFDYYYGTYYGEVSPPSPSCPPDCDRLIRNESNRSPWWKPVVGVLALLTRPNQGFRSIISGVISQSRPDDMANQARDRMSGNERRLGVTVVQETGRRSIPVQNPKVDADIVRDLVVGLAPLVSGHCAAESVQLIETAGVFTN